MTFDKQNFFIGIIGSGPIGLECGLHALKHGYQFIIFESGDDIANNIRLWSHVQLFTPLHMNVSLLGKDLLKKDHDNNAFLTGSQFIECYLRPVSCHLQPNIRLRHKVISIGRYHTNKFIILVENKDNDCEEYFIVDCVIDASGTYNNPNFVGPNNVPAVNERALRIKIPSPITYLIPNLKYEQLAGKRILLIGKGYSAATSALYLAKVKEAYPETQLYWIIKQSINELPYCNNPEDPLEQRRQLTDNVNQIYANKRIFTEIYVNTVVTKLTYSASSTAVDVTLDSSPCPTLCNIDYIIANAGSQPDRNLYANLNVQECYRSKGPLALAVKLLSSSNADCLKQISHGRNSMLTTEKNFFIVGNKSYGKQTNFILQIGFEQVNDVFELINEQH
ncbi:unnamed protein product [Rotaria sp. Silwood2]|nr:unnamed protein product [Rotaria sp. Silwood2]CAF3194142.1 unnamed protein product [Rotaria sp. Silwood2]CAF3967791.1 unnamed protein product [Rotaria sp. Silwood2]CAF3972317.1 unnamed protein product [Rotaria sp. Silwood2]CAF4360274.1 unnamed protein product [Rotaria sp. Silwood2]